MLTLKSVFGLSVVPGLLLTAMSASASTYYFGDLTSRTLSTGTTPGSASGTLTTPSGTIDITYSGDVTTATQVNNTGVNYYAGFSGLRKFRRIEPADDQRSYCAKRKLHCNAKCPDIFITDYESYPGHSKSGPRPQARKL